MMLQFPAAAVRHPAEAQHSNAYNNLIQFFNICTTPKECSFYLDAAETCGKNGFVTESELLTLRRIGRQKRLDLAQPEEPKKEAAKNLSVNKRLLGIADPDDPDRINLYPIDFAAKAELSAIIDQYNQSMRDAGREDGVIDYTDYIGIFLSSVTTIINVVSYVLIAFVAISLVVSSIMIGIITYISVLERTKEIGILRSIGASKRDISRVFNAETLIVGLAAGVIGIIATLLLNIPVNLLIKALVDISNVSRLPFAGAAALIVISVLLTMFAGLIPSRYAAKRDPVEALRTE